ncbi:MAG: hypothetical protein ACTS2F_09770 [Thainema sp.]
MNGVAWNEIAIYEVVETSVCIDNIVIVPCFYELFPCPAKYQAILDFSLERYMLQEHLSFADFCPAFYKFIQPSLRFESENWQDAIWVRSKIISVYNFYPPQAYSIRHSLLNIPFVAVFLDESSSIAALHPFACVEDELKAGLGFYQVTTPEECSIISAIFWKSLLAEPKLADFIDRVVGWAYDYESPVMGSDFVTGYWKDEFHLVLLDSAMYY